MCDYSVNSIGLFADTLYMKLAFLWDFEGGGKWRSTPFTLPILEPSTFPKKTAIWGTELLDASSPNGPSHKRANNYKSRTEELQKFSSFPDCFHVAEDSNHDSVHFLDTNHTTHSVVTTLRASQIRSSHATMSHHSTATLANTVGTRRHAN